VNTNETVGNEMNKATNTVSKIVSNLNINVSSNTNANGNANMQTKKAPTREEYEKNKETYSKQAKGSGSKIGSGAEDVWLWAKIRGGLLEATDLSSSDISVDVENGVVTLRGSVPDAAQKAKAEQIAKSVSGVKSVHNQLTFSGGNKAANSKK
jgi:osmotically-inducible protein OsmY